MPQLTINRISGFSNRLRKIKLVLDGQVIYEIKNGETKTIDIEPGTHILHAKIDWCQSNIMQFSMAEGESKTINLKGTNPLLAIYYITFGKNDYLKLVEAES